MPRIRTRFASAALAGALAVAAPAAALSACAAARDSSEAPAAAATPAAADSPLIEVTLEGTDEETRQGVIEGSLAQQPGLLRISLEVPRGTSGGSLKLMALRAGYTEGQYRADADALSEAYNEKALGLTRKIQENVRMVAGIAAEDGHAVTMTIDLGPGTYYLGTDESEDPLPQHKLVVSGTARPGDLPVAEALVAADGPGITGADILAARGALQYSNNAGDGWHQLVIQRVGDRTTNAQVANYFADPFAEDAPEFHEERLLVGPLGLGQTILVEHDLPAGTYMVADYLGVDPSTGETYAKKGMHKVVTFR